MNEPRADAALSPDSGPSRLPVQGRSRASFARMLAATTKLLEDSVGDDFTIADISRVGKVSIGSIYGRFDSKDDLIRAVQARVMAEIDGEMAERLEDAARAAPSMDELVSRLIEAFADVLRKHAQILRPLMLRGVNDEIIAAAGKRSHIATEAIFVKSLLIRGAEIPHADPERAARAVFRTVFASMARYLGIDSSTTAAWEGDWKVLKEDLEAMSSAYLRHGRYD